MGLVRRGGIPRNKKVDTWSYVFPMDRKDKKRGITNQDLLWPIVWAEHQPSPVAKLLELEFVKLASGTARKSTGNK